MSSPATMATAEILRDQSELEGSLLPLASEVSEALHPPSVPAVPVGHFDYDAAALQFDEYRVAFAIPESNKAAISDDSRPRVKSAQHTGLLAAEQEKEEIQRAKQKIFSQHYFNQEAIRTANHIAKQNDRRNQQVQPQIHSSTEWPTHPSPATICDLVDDDGPKQPRSLRQQPNCERESGKKGYDVQEYSFETDYETSEYQVKEYKSVYD